MCGIAGIIKWTHDRPAPWHSGGHTPATFPPLAQISANLAHRGPDGSGLFTDPRTNTTAALIHRRLAIIDRPTGQQPMPNEDRSVHVVFNGEIYNHADLRSQLLAAGHSFASHHSDTEVLVHGWEQWGTELPSKLLGMFAFAIYDTRNNQNTLFLARDRMGQKPLFYASLEDGLVFASTIPALLAWPEVPRRVPKEQIALYLLLGYLPAPQTIFRDISQLLPGSWLLLQNDVLTGNRYWTPAPPISNPQSQISNLKSPISNFQSPISDLRPTLSRAVSSQLIADTPIACFLSGGLDSSIIATLMQQSVSAAAGPPIQTVSVGFAESPFDESPYAAAVAQKIGSRHTRLEVSPHQNVLETLSLLMTQSLGQPFADSSILPTFHLSQAVRQIAPVALSGDGADELFAGYDRYRAMILLHRFRPLARLLPKSLPLGSLAKKERYRRFAAAARASILSEQYTRLVEIFPLPLAESLLQSDIMDYFPLPEEYGLPENPSPLRLAMLRDQSEYLPSDLLYKVDTASMSHALEVRSPFLDHHLVHLANSLPPSSLIQHGRGKAPLLQLFTHGGLDLPPQILSRPKKGFAVPIGQWFRTSLRQPLTDLLFSRNSFTTQHLHPPTVNQLLTEHQSQTRDHTHRLFSLLMLELFWQSFSPTLE